MTLRTWKEQQAAEADVRNRMRMEWLQSLAASGLNHSALARQTGMDRTSLVQMLKKFGIETARPRRADEYRKCAAEGMTAAETARTLGVRLSTVRSMVTHYGIKFRDGRRKPEVTEQAPQPALPVSFATALSPVQQRQYRALTSEYGVPHMEALRRIAQASGVTA